METTAPCYQLNTTHQSLAMEDTTPSKNTCPEMTHQECFLDDLKPPEANETDCGITLPSFQETYSPRYRREVFRFDELIVSTNHPTSPGLQEQVRQQTPTPENFVRLFLWQSAIFPVQF